MHRLSCYFVGMLLACAVGCTGNGGYEPPIHRVPKKPAIAKRPATNVDMVKRGGVDPTVSQWGNLSATFSYDGEAPELEKLDLTPPGFALPLFDESLIVDKETKGVANIAVWLHVKYGEPLPIVHPDHEEAVKVPVEMTIRNGRFEPRITMVRARQIMKIRNADTVGHNWKGDFLNNPPLSDLFPVGATMKKTFSKAESRPMPIADHIHPWMSGHVLIKDHSYMAVSNSQGKLEIKNLPTGTHTFVLWHELAGFIREAKRNGETQEFKLGRITVDIKPGDNDLGEFVIKPAKR